MTIDRLNLSALAVASSDSVATLWYGEALIALITITTLEIVLGIDNVVFISMLAGKLPATVQRRVPNIGLGLAMIMQSLRRLSIV